VVKTLVGDQPDALPTLLQSTQPDGFREYQALIDLWLDESDYDPKWDGAVRDWARTSEVVRQAVESVDDQRVKIIEKMFLHMGFKGKEAKVRATSLSSILSERSHWIFDQRPPPPIDRR
jgi:hypothetical protein